MQVHSSYDQHYESNGQNYYPEAQTYPDNYWYPDSQPQMPDQFDPQRKEYLYDYSREAQVQDRHFNMHQNGHSHQQEEQGEAYYGQFKTYSQQFA